MAFGIDRGRPPLAPLPKLLAPLPNPSALLDSQAERTSTGVAGSGAGGRRLTFHVEGYCCARAREPVPQALNTSPIFTIG